MAEITVTIKNLPQIRSAFRKAPVKMATELNEAIKKSIFTIERESKPRTPVDTGRLRASLGGGSFEGGSYKEGHGRLFKKFYGEIGSNVKYALFVHDGTSRMKARPFLMKGVKASETQIDGFFTKAVQNALDDIARSI